MINITEQCPCCKGTGFIYCKGPCENCKGKGHVVAHYNKSINEYFK